jgi:hypothetical protein
MLMTLVVNKAEGIRAGGDWRYSRLFILMTGKASLPVFFVYYLLFVHFNCSFFE